MTLNAAKSSRRVGEESKSVGQSRANAKPFPATQEELEGVSVKKVKLQAWKAEAAFFFGAGACRAFQIPTLCAGHMCSSAFNVVPKYDFKNCSQFLLLRTNLVFLTTNEDCS